MVDIASAACPQKAFVHHAPYGGMMSTYSLSVRDVRWIPYSVIKHEQRLPCMSQG